MTKSIARRVKTTIGTAHSLLSVLQRMDNDPSLKLSDAARLAVIININRLLPDIQGYEKARNQIYVELSGEDSKKEFNNNHAAARDIELREQPYSVTLRLVMLADLTATKGEHFIGGLAALKPMIKDFEDDEDVEHDPAD